MKNPLALIVDDEPDILELLSITLGRMRVDTKEAATLQEARQLLEDTPFDMCLTDLRLPDGDGIELVKHIQQVKPNLPVAVITAHGNMQTAIEAMKAGAFDFLSKPIDLNTLRDLVKNALHLQPPAPTTKESDIPTGSPRLIGSSSRMSALRQTIAKVSRSQAPIHITGESGTGKELVARLIHALGPRKEGPFVPVNCGAIPGELMESEFFGHKKGSFTGAIADKPGLFQTADGGTLFLDEVADLPLTMQVKLLRAIQERAVRPVGASKEIAVNVRIVSATHKDLAELVNAGQFRQDLFYRINVISVTTPSLRDRIEDIPELAQYILKKLSERHHVDEPKLTASAINGLKKYAFPGNIRELENILERALTLADGHEIEIEDLQLPDSPMEVVDPAALAMITPGKRGDIPLDMYLEKIERDAVLEALEFCRWNKTQAARKLGISFRAMRYKLQKLGLE
ncbi:sigma-54-dependent transcriptional regulator [Permianibacter aggregans]|uniref:Two-component response regulator PilR n=1 Tax=Permianibacter aggregans TaxID=1510150 RepID=A0A4R6UVL8_9GAMM|nr:sigma-54 dependent transcriptional regulator [Permianibacter aggregans]QGX41478.1 sigma-54-dependent Fis family transcriptional regulator [Permianibacter aggregans]TDQ51271.1 two-component response regulator PilR [Permianibacter aggregans]